ncbi:TPA: glycosyltransferase [Legionella pneumophila]|uniref:glycosyltransferase n=1 Tax=Legionella pneumophila TaxID=446 RepID=UPI003EEAB1E8
MNIVLLALGSRGDIQPFIALALGLKKLNHTVVIATHDEHSALIYDYGIAHYPLSGSPIELLGGKQGQRLMATTNPLAAAKIFSSMQLTIANTILVECWLACQHADAIVYGVLGTNIASSIAEKLNIKAIPAYSQPLHPTAEFPYPLKRVPKQNGALRRLAGWYFMEILLWYYFRPQINQWRIEQLNLPPIKQSFLYWRTIRQNEELALYNMSPSIFKKPKDWRDHIKITGYWYLPAASNWQPDKPLLDFLLAGSPPIYIGFGSVVTVQDNTLIQLISDALLHTKQRGVLSGHWPKSVLDQLPPHLIYVKSIPHDWLFPKTTGIIHHGGAGITAAALLAGKPSIPIPFFLDQPYWSHSIAKLGAATQPIPYKKLTFDNLTAAINELINNKSLSYCAKELQTKIVKEDGVSKAAGYITDYLNHRSTL